VEDEAAKILISFKAGKKVATSGKRKIRINGKKKVVQSGIIVPRGALHEQFVYGKIKTQDFKKPIKYLFENPHLICKGYIKDIVEKRLAQYDNNLSNALKSIKKEPLYLDTKKEIPLEYATCYKDEYVIKYKITDIKIKDVPSIIDKRVKELVSERLKEFNNKEKEAFAKPLWYNEEKKIPVLSVRCFTGLSAVEPIKKDESGRNIGFAKTGNNHHIAIYTNEMGNRIEHSCTFWHAVERKKLKFPVIIENSVNIWSKVLSEKNEMAEIDFAKKYTETF
jgi:CRISPR-associated endonuclease Csn1